MFDLATRSAYIHRQIENGKNIYLQDSNVKLHFVEFNKKWSTGKVSTTQSKFEPTEFCNQNDESIFENKHFRYPVFVPTKGHRNKCIILLHGLNERSWEKYGCWAEELAILTGKPVLLFPLAFHMNRSPLDWCNPRVMIQYVKERRMKLGESENLTFANLALSDRLSLNPLRFYASGRETGDNLWQLLNDIKKGKHPLLKKDTQIDIFGYSIGVLLAQVMLISNPEDLLSESRLFGFCGGSVFNKMDGNSRYIMDKEAFNKIHNYYQYDFLNQNASKTDLFEQPFKMMIDDKRYSQTRTNFFEKSSNKIRIISLKRDVVIPSEGIEIALGKQASKKSLMTLDFDFSYCHETPFPNDLNKKNEINRAFLEIFGDAGAFLS